MNPHRWIEQNPIIGLENLIWNRFFNHPEMGFNPSGESGNMVCDRENLFRLTSALRKNHQLAVSVLIVLLAHAAGTNRAEGASPSIGGYNVYYGQLHGHTNISDGIGTPDAAYKYARDNAKLDFFSIADHDDYPYNSPMTSADYTTVKNAANSYNVDETFVAFWGYEWTSDDQSWGGPSTLLGKGHIAIINSPDFVSAANASYNDLNELVAWLSARDAVAFFNHPGEYGTTFDNFNFNKSDKIAGMELWNRSTDYYGSGTWYHSALNKGFHIGAAGSGDNHSADWGTQNEWRMAVLAPLKTRDSIYSAMKARRFYSSRDKNLALSFKCNGAQMGSRTTGGALNIEIEATDADNENFSKIDLLKNGSLAQTWTPNTTHPQVTATQNGGSGDYFYIRVYQSGTAWAAISSPIFITSSVGTIPRSRSPGTFSVPAAGLTAISMVDIRGKIIGTFTVPHGASAFSTANIAGKNLLPGIYIVKQNNQTAFRMTLGIQH